MHDDSLPWKAQSDHVAFSFSSLMEPLLWPWGEIVLPSELRLKLSELRVVVMSKVLTRDSLAAIAKKSYSHLYNMATGLVNPGYGRNGTIYRSLFHSVSHILEDIAQSQYVTTQGAPLLWVFKSLSHFFFYLVSCLKVMAYTVISVNSKSVSP